LRLNAAFTPYLAFLFTTPGMDLGSFRHSEPEQRDRMAAPLDFFVLQATLQAFQSASATARAQAEPPPAKSPKCGHDPLVEVLLGGPNWREAVGEQGGSFNRSYARRGSDET
jgi:hypothetical protein